jgi:cytosine/adenosine deaminase-related metal-dependent hydrolase
VESEGMSPTLLIRDVLALDPDSSLPPSRKDILVADGRIAAVRVGRSVAAPEARIVDGRKRLLIPGLVNAHTHSPLNILKGTGDILSHSAFMWRNQADTAGRTPDEIRLSALLGCIEHLLNGTTAVIDHFPEQGFDLACVEAVVDAYRISGMRAVVALRIFDEPYTDIEPAGGFPQESMIENPLAPPPLAESLVLVEEAIRRFDGAAGGRIRVCPAPSNPMRCSDALLEAVRDIAERYDTGIHMHLLETAVQAKIARQRYGNSMVQHLDDLGLLSRRLSTAHTIWLDDDDIALMAARGAVPVHNPESNLKLGAGISPIARMLRAGVAVALGTDGAGTNDNLDMHEVMRLAVILQRPGEPDRRKWPSARDALNMATVNGGRALRVDGLGFLQAGAPADFTLHNLDTPSWTPVNDPLMQLVYAASGATVDTIIVGGAVLVENRRITTFDSGSVVAAVQDLVPRLRARNQALRGWTLRLEELVE